MSGEGPRGWAGPLHGRVLDRAGIGAGTPVLDAGCGTGAFAAAAVANGALVHGVDADPGAVARAAAAVPGATFAVGDATAVTGRYAVAVGVQLLGHVPDPVAVLRALGRAAPVVAVTAWGPEDACEVRAFGEALEPVLGPRRPAPALDLAALATAAHLAVSSLEDVVCPFTYADVDDVLAPLFTSGLGSAAVRAAGPVAVRDAVLTRLEPHRSGESYVLRNVFRVLVARS